MKGSNSTLSHLVSKNVGRIKEIDAPYETKQIESSMRGREDEEASETPKRH